MCRYGDWGGCETVCVGVDASDVSYCVPDAFFDAKPRFVPGEKGEEYGVVAGN